MATDNKIAANRKNALSSTGPKSKLGKSKSSGNATKHGVYSVKTLLRGEDENLYEAVKEEQRRRFSPKTFVEKALVDQLVGELWRLRRISRAEYLLALEIQQDLNDDSDPLEFTGKERKLLKLIKNMPSEGFFGRAEVSEAEKGSEVNSVTQKQYRKLKSKIGRIDEVYSDMFLDASHEKTQKLMLLKRQAIQTILSIERELERRKLNRGSEVVATSTLRG